MKLTRVKLSVAIDAEMKGTILIDTDFDLVYKDGVVYAKSKKEKLKGKIFMIFPTNIAYMTLELSDAEKEKTMIDIIGTAKKA